MILLDTHVLLWLTMEPKKLSRVATAAIERAVKGGGLAIASVTLLECAWLLAKGRVRTAGSVSSALGELLEATAADVLELTPDIAATAVQLPNSVPTDPADRLIVATAIVHGLSLVTRDARIADSETCRTIW